MPDTDTDSFDLQPQAVGLWAISAELSFTKKDDQELLCLGLNSYEALYRWATFVSEGKHHWNPQR